MIIVKTKTELENQINYLKENEYEVFKIKYTDINPILGKTKNLPKYVIYTKEQKFSKGGKTWVQDVEDSKSFDKGGFSREAASRGMSTQQLFNKVMKNPQSEPEHLYRQAMFMKNAYNFK